MTANRLSETSRRIADGNIAEAKRNQIDAYHEKSAYRGTTIVDSPGLALFDLRDQTMQVAPVGITRRTS